MPDNKTIVVQLIAQILEEIQEPCENIPECLGKVPYLMDDLKERLNLDDSYFTDRDFLAALLKEMKSNV